MADVDVIRLKRVLSRLQNLPNLAFPTDYPRPAAHRLVESIHTQALDTQASRSLLKLAASYGDDSDEAAEATPPSPFQMLLASFLILLHRYTGDTDLVVASSPATVRDPVLLRVNVEPTDLFWDVVKRVREVAQQAEEDIVSYESVVQALKVSGGTEQDGAAAPLFRVRFFDEEDAGTSDFIRSTSLTTDLSVFVARSLPSTLKSGASSTHASLTPQINIRIAYNSLLFTPIRIQLILDQLSALLKEVSRNPNKAIGAVSLLTLRQKAEILPDPSKDLDWCGWKRAITDVFSRNARAHPDRPCVIQSIATSSYTPIEQQERVTYTYGEILAASNILSHHLVKAGLERGNVVMVYAYRSVEMVVAVMAILKAGCTFSVIGW